MWYSLLAWHFDNMGGGHLIQKEAQGTTLCQLQVSSVAAPGLPSATVPALPVSHQSVTLRTADRETSLVVGTESENLT